MNDLLFEHAQQRSFLILIVGDGQLCLHILWLLRSTIDVSLLLLQLARRQ